MAIERLSLAEQIAQLEETAPADYDPEDLQSRGPEMEDEMHVDGSSTREHYVDVGPSALRNLLPSVADPKYEGVRTSRKQLLEDSDEGPSDEGEGEGDEDFDEEGSASEDVRPIERQAQGRADNLSDDDSPSESMQSGEGSDEEESVPRESPSRQTVPNEGPAEDVTSTLKKSREDDMKKGQAVKRQIALWDTLLDTRIRLQKSVVSANKLPPPSQIKEYLDEPTCRDSVSKLFNEASLLTDELCELQETLLKTNDVINPPPRKRRKLDTETTSAEEYAEAFVTATEDAAALETAFHPYLLQTLSKWSSKIQAVAPSALLPSNRGAFLKGSQNLKSAVQLIDETLADSGKLLARTQAARVNRSRIGVASEENAEITDGPDPEVFDDTDFYQKMLRDIIDARGDGNKNEDWMLLQKQKKAKKKVDTKASKGRKLRYEVHEKLQNFMVPVPVPGAWHDEQIDELFASLLGKGFENVSINAEEPQVQQSIELTGFRVFG